MRKITTQAVEAFKNGVEFASGNTSVIVEGKNVKLTLWGHIVAKRDSKRVWVSHCGYDTNTTKERLNGVINEFGNPYEDGIYVRKGVMYIKIDGVEKVMEDKFYRVK